MTRKFALLMASGLALTLAASPASAKKGGNGKGGGNTPAAAPAPTPAPTPAPSLGGGGCQSDLAFSGGSSLVNCYGRYGYNVLNSGGIGEINAAFTALGYTGPAITFSDFDATKIDFLDTDSSMIDFNGIFNGTLYFGLKTGGGGPNGVGMGTTFYRINAVNLDSFKFLPSGESSGGFVLVPTPPPVVPEPGTWAMLILGFGAAGGAMRVAHRRRGELALG